MRSERWQKSHCLSWYKRRRWPSFAHKSIFVGVQELAGTRQRLLEHKDWRPDGSLRVRGGGALCPRVALLGAETDPSARISPLGTWEGVSKGGSSPSSALLSPLAQTLGSPAWLGWGEARSRAPRASIFQGTWVLLITWGPHQGAQTIADTVLVVLLTPGPHVIHIPSPGPAACVGPHGGIQAFADGLRDT